VPRRGRALVACSFSWPVPLLFRLICFPILAITVSHDASIMLKCRPAWILAKEVYQHTMSRRICSECMLTSALITKAPCRHTIDRSRKIPLLDVYRLIVNVGAASAHHRILTTKSDGKMVRSIRNTTSSDHAWLKTYSYSYAVAKIVF